MELATRANARGPSICADVPRLVAVEPSRGFRSNGGLPKQVDFQLNKKGRYGHACIIYSIRSRKTLQSMGTWFLFILPGGVSGGSPDLLQLFGAKDAPTAAGG